MPSLSTGQPRAVGAVPLRWLGAAGEARLADRLGTVSARWRGAWADPLARGTPSADLRRGPPDRDGAAATEELALHRELCDRQGEVMMCLRAVPESLLAWLAVEPWTAPAAAVRSTGAIAAAVLAEVADSLLQTLGEELAVDVASTRAATGSAPAAASIGPHGWWATLALRVDGAPYAPLQVGLAPAVVDRSMPRPGRPLAAAGAVPRRMAVRDQSVPVEVLIGRCRATAEELRAVRRGDVLLFDPDSDGAPGLRRRACGRPLGSVSVGASGGRWAARIDAWDGDRSGDRG